jgi:hypothetical protein
MCRTGFSRNCEPRPLIFGGNPDFLILPSNPRISGRLDDRGL